MTLIFFCKSLDSAREVDKISVSEVACGADCDAVIHLVASCDGFRPQFLTNIIEWPLLCSGPAVSPRSERRGFFVWFVEVFDCRQVLHLCLLTGQTRPTQNEPVVWHVVCNLAVGYSDA